MNPSMSIGSWRAFPVSTTTPKSAARQSSAHNRLLAALPPEDFARLQPVRREGVTEAASKLQAEGLIHYSRGHITVLDRPQLEARVCECYAVVRRETDRLFPAEISVPDFALVAEPNRVRAA